MRKQKLKIAMLGLGTVGSGVINLISKQRGIIKRRTGVDLEIKTICAKSKRKKRPFNISAYNWSDDPISLTKDKDIDVIVELIGGENGVSKKVIEEGIKQGKHIVTANKALLANHGGNLANLAEKYKVALRYEAAVAGGIPIIRALSESLISNRLTSIYGVINGTCNYILTKMETEGRDYNDVFSEAKKLGYVEADPELDIGGIDSAHKLAILSSLAFGTKLDYRNVLTKGIKNVSLEDIKEASNMGFKIKLLARAEYNKGILEQEVAPCLVKKTIPLAQVQGSTNIIVLEGEDIGETVFSGPGAGMGPTASAVVADLISVAGGHQTTPSLNSISVSKRPSKVANRNMNAFYIRFQLKDKSGVLALLSSKLSSQKISISQMKQKASAKGEATLIMTTHKTMQENLNKSLEEIKSSKICFGEPVSIRIQEI